MTKIDLLVRKSESLLTKSEAIAILSITYTNDKEDVKLRRIERILNQIKYSVRKEFFTDKNNKVKEGVA